MQRLRACQRRLLYLRYHQGKSLAAAAKEMGVSSSWASRLHARALATLRTAAKARFASPPPQPTPRNEKHPGDSVPTDRSDIAKNGSS
jgi:RNA polymerase sigma factor for flagellar operon FliA